MALPFVMNQVTAQLTAWSQEPQNAQTINGLQGGENFFNWLNQPTNPLLNNIVGLVPNPTAIKQDLKTIMDTAERNGGNADGLRQAYEQDPRGFMAAVKSGNPAAMDQLINQYRGTPTALDARAEMENAEQNVLTVVQDPDKTPGQQLNGAILLETLQGVLAGDKDIGDLFQVFQNFIETILGTKFDGIAQQLTQTVDRLGLKPEEQAPAPAPNRDPSAQPNASQPTTQPTTEPSLAGPGM
jgi:hypothetical protein